MEEERIGITEREAKDIISVFNHGMPIRQLTRDRLAKLSIRLERLIRLYRKPKASKYLHGNLTPMK